MHIKQQIFLNIKIIINESYKQNGKGINGEVKNNDFNEQADSILLQSNQK